MSLIDTFFEAGVHYGYSKTRRHPFAIPFIFATKNKNDIIDLQKTEEQVNTAKSVISTVQNNGKVILFVGVKPEARTIVRDEAQSISMPFVTERWVGGTLTNWPEIKRRLARLADLKAQKESGNLERYTKKERLLIEREIEKMEKNFSGISTMTKLPDLMVVVDQKREHIAVTEAKKMNIPVIALGNTDCDGSYIDYPIVGNDSSVKSIRAIIHELVKAYKGE